MVNKVYKNSCKRKLYELNLIKEKTVNRVRAGQAMNIKFKDATSMQSRAKARPTAHVPLSSPSIFSEASSPKFNNIYKERPFKTNSTNLSFKGLFFSPVIDKATKAQRHFNSKEIIETTEKYLGSSTRELFESIKDSKLTIKNRLFTYNDQTKDVTFHKKSILHLIYDGVVYPIVRLPGEILNGIVGALKKVKPLQKWAEKMYDKPFLKNLRQKSKIESKINALRGMFETVEQLKADKKTEAEITADLLQKSAKMFDLSTGNYDTKHERSLCRVVSGMIPAFFLANDAYNLSSACDNDPKAAAKEKKTRFRQEISRVGLNAYITLITLGAIQKYVNNSKIGIMLNTALTVLFTESFARLSNGKQITRMTPGQAKAYNEKHNKEKLNSKGGLVDYNTVAFKADKNKIADSSEGKNPQFKGDVKADPKDKKQPLLSFNTVLKASAVIIATGFGIKSLRSIKVKDSATQKVKKPVADAIDKLLKPFNDYYKKITKNPHHTIEQAKFDQIVDLLDKNGYKGLAAKYKEVAEDRTKNGLVDLGSKDKKIKPVVDFVIAPFKFIFNTIKLPYTLADKVVGSLVKKEVKTPDMDAENLKALAKSIDKMAGELFKKGQKIEDADLEKFKSYVNDSINKSFNVDNMSNISNSELANLAKTSATAATIWFLMTDNYNMVMQKSNGEDKDGAELKFKERFVQEGSRLFYQTLLIDLFNSTFRSQYNSSLWGMTWITASNTVISEMLNRKSVGMPIKAHSRDELLQIEKKKEESTGIARGYYDFMARLTGKKSLAEQHQDKTAKKAEIAKA